MSELVTKDFYLKTLLRELYDGTKYASQIYQLREQSLRSFDSSNTLAYYNFQANLYQYPSSHPLVGHLHGFSVAISFFY